MKNLVTGRELNDNAWKQQLRKFEIFSESWVPIRLSLINHFQVIQGLKKTGLIFDVRLCRSTEVIHNF